MTLWYWYTLLPSFKKDQLKKIHFTPEFQELEYMNDIPYFY